MDALPNVLTVPTVLGDVAVHIGGRGPAVLLLHANTSDSRDFDGIRPTLERHFTVAALDWPGFGSSTVTDPDKVTRESCFDVALAVLDALAAIGIRRMSVVGNSLGGYVAVRLARTRTEAVSCLVLSSPGGFTAVNPVSRLIARRVIGSPVFAKFLTVPMARAYLGRRRTPSSQATFERARQIRRQPQRLAVHSSLWRSFVDPASDLSPDMPTSIPTQLIWGRRDPILPIFTDGRRARRLLPQAEWVSVAAAHEVYNEAPDEFLAHALPFLNKHAASES